MDDLTTKQMLDKLGLKSPRTLRHWRELGLIPSPYVGPHPDGRGRLALWPVWLLDRCLEIREKLRAGLTLEEIASTVKKRKYRFADAWAEREQKLRLFRIRQAATQSLRKSARIWREVLDDQLLSDDQFQEALKLDGEGHQLILLIAESGSMVIPFSQLSDKITRLPASSALAIIPLSHLLRVSINPAAADESDNGP